MDAPEEPVGDDSLAAALRARARRIQLLAVVGGAAYGVGVWLAG